jgi:hypothetical protein
MMSINRQCDEAMQLLAAIQTCVDREGWVIPWRAADFQVYVERAREQVGVVNVPRRT